MFVLLACKEILWLLVLRQDAAVIQTVPRMKNVTSSEADTTKKNVNLFVILEIVLKELIALQIVIEKHVLVATLSLAMDMLHVLNVSLHLNVGVMRESGSYLHDFSSCDC